jgi:hypothetical protein
MWLAGIVVLWTRKRVLRKGSADLIYAHVSAPRQKNLQTFPVFLPVTDEYGIARFGAAGTLPPFAAPKGQDNIEGNKLEAPMKSKARNNRFYNENTFSAGFRMFTAALLIFGFATAPLAQSPIQGPRTLPTAPLLPIGFSNVVTKTRTFSLSVTPTDLSDDGPSSTVTGTGAIRLTGNLVNASGCCARIKVEMIRITTREIVGGSPGQVFKQQTFEFCGSQAVNFSDNLNASEDDARFKVQITNLDAWNKVTVNGALLLTYPTADRILAPQPSTPVDLTRGVDVSRIFTLSPNTAGRLKVEIRWSGGASLQAKLFKPGQQFGAAFNGVLNQTSSSGALDLNYDIQPADISAGVQWAVNALNNSSSSITATGITFRVIYTVEE